MGLWEDDPQPMLVTRVGHLYEVQEVELKNDVCQESIDYLGRLTTFSFYDVFDTTFIQYAKNCFLLED